MGVKVYHNNQWVEFSTGSNASASFLVQDEGNDLVGLATALNFKGSGVTASNTTGNPSTKEIEITGVTSFIALTDTPNTYVGTAGSVVTVNSTADGLEFLAADSTGVGRDNYVDSAAFTSLAQGGAKLTLTYAGPDSSTLPNVTADLTIGTLGIGFTQLSDTPANYTGVGNSFVRVKSDQTGLEFVAQVPGTAVGAVGINSQVQYNDNGNLNGAEGLLYVKGDESDGDPAANLILKPNYTDFTSNTDAAIYGGGRITAQSNDISSTISTPWNRASITADGGLELFRSRITSPSGGPYIDFKSQLDGNNHPVDMDARIQMDYDRDANAPNNIDPNGADYSAILFETGGNGHYKTGNLGGRVTEKLRIGKFGEIGLNAGITRYDPTANPPIVDNQGSNRLPEADIYGNPGEVLMSGGKGSTVYWGTNGAGNTLWTQNSNGIYRDSNVMIRRSDNANNASLAVHGVTNLSGNVNSSKTVLDLRNINDNADCLTFRNIRLTQDNNAAPTWYSAAWRIQRRVDVTDQGYIQFGAGDNSPSGTFNSEIIFGNESGEKLRITSVGNVGIGTTNPTAAVGVGNTAVLAVGIVSAYQFYGDGSNLTGVSGSGGSVVTSIQTFTTSGNHTYTPTSGTTSIVVHCIGAGGATGSPNQFAWIGGGGAGGVAIRAYNSTELGPTAAITVGAKGVGSGGQGSPQAGGGIDGAGGGNSSFTPSGTGIGCTGGGGSGSPKGSGAGNFTEGGAGGTGSGGDLNFSGEKGYTNRATPDKWSYLNNQSSSNYYIDSIKSKPAGGGYGEYGLGAPSVSIQDTSSLYSNGRSGEDGAVIIYEYAGSGGSGSGSSFVLLSEQASTSGTEVEFTGIPSDALEITLMFTGVSASGTNNFMVQLGTASGYIETGYDSLSQNEGGSDDTAATDCFLIRADANNHLRTGAMVITKASGSSYVQTGSFALNPSGVQGGTQTYGSLTSVSGTVNRLRVKLNGTNTFDAGTISVSYKTSASGGGTNKIQQGNTKAEVIDTGSDGKFVVTTEGVERVVVDPNGYLNSKSDIRIRREGGAAGTQNNGGIYFGDSNNNYIFGEDSVEILTLTGGSGNFIAGETVTGALSNKTAIVKSWDSSSLELVIHDKTGSFTISETITSPSNTTGRNVQSFTTTNADLLTFATGGNEKLRIKGHTDTTFANSDDIQLNQGGGVPQTTQVTGVINMGTSYYHDGTGTDLGKGSGHYGAVKLHLFKNGATGQLPQDSINNIYGLGVSHGMMEIQTDAVLGFFVGNDGTNNGSRLERMRITTSGHVSINGSTTAERNQSNHRLQVYGSFAASSKSFVIDHPTKENHTLTHGSLEGPEHAVYVRGKTSGSVINLPDYWVGLVHDDSITVNLTPIGNKRVWVESINNNSVTVGSDDSTEYFYTIFAERKDIDKLVVEVEK